MRKCKNVADICVLLLVLTVSGEHNVSVLTADYDTEVELIVDANREYIIRFPPSTSLYPFSVSTWMKKTYPEYPVMVAVRQINEIISWELPVSVKTNFGSEKYLETSRTLCHTDMETIKDLPPSAYAYGRLPNNKLSVLKEISLVLSTSSITPVEVTAKVKHERGFYITSGINYSVTISPSQPKFFYYTFQKDHTVLLDVESEDDVCFTLSIQEPNCPVYDLNEDINYIGKFQTVNKRGGMILTRHRYPQGFFLVFVAKGDDSDCTSHNALNPWSIRTRSSFGPTNNYRTSNIHFKMKATLSESEYIVTASAILIAMLCFYILSSALTLYCFREKLSKRNQDEGTMSRNDGAISTLHVSQDVADMRLSRSNLMLCDMSFQDPKYSQKFSLTYLWHIISIAIFYGIPVVQLAVTYQKVVNKSGDQDICYYNFLCAYPFSLFSDTNHIISNTGYVVMGTLFLAITLFRDKRAKATPHRGIPRQYGLYYAMGVALIMEGVLSASYHICPNQSNFQFDTSFMYVMAVLCMVKLYENRHPEVNATSHATFMVLGFSIWFAMVGILNAGLAIWILFVIFHVLLCFYISANIYFLSYLKRGVRDFIGGLRSESTTIYQRLAPRRKEHFILLVIANLLNILMACGGVSSYFYGIDFATFLLGILMANAIIYVVVYVIMKLLYKERICKIAATFGILALGTWTFAGFFFLQNSTSWTLTPAQSKQANRECDLLRIFDDHDIWHLLSAAALFFSFMLLLTLDDDLINTHHSKIHVF